MKKKRIGSDQFKGGKLLLGAVAEKVEMSIVSGAFKVGDMIPAERDLSEHCQVSRVTVRAALALLEKEGLIQRIPRIGYKVVRRRRSDVSRKPVGLVVEGFRGAPFLPMRIEAFERLLTDSDRVMMVGVSRCEAERENACIRRFKEAGAGGLIVSPARAGERSLALEQWIDQSGPVVLEGHPGAWLLDDERVARCSRVDVDNRDGIFQCMHFLINMGHRRIGMLCSDNPRCSERLAAFKAFMGTHDLPVKPEWVVTGVSGERAGGHVGFRRLAAAPAMPTAMLCTLDDLALGLMDAAHASGRTCPGDLSVIGFSNESAEGRDSLRELTTVGWSTELAARETLLLLDAQMGGHFEPRTVKVPVELIVRNSCAPPAANS